MPHPSTAALPIAYVVLRILIVLNWFFGACILGLLVFTFISEPWTMKALGVTGYPDAQKVMNGMRVDRCARRGRHPAQPCDPQAAARDGRDGSGRRSVRRRQRLSAAAPSPGCCSALQLLSLVIAAIAKAISTAEHPFDLDAGFSVNGWLAVILTFVLARVFAEGTLMREDLEGTV